MKKLFFLSAFICILVGLSFAQNDKDKMIFKKYEPGFYHNVILKDVNAVNKSLKKPKEKKFPEMDQSSMDLPNKLSHYTKIWHNPPISQGNAGTCWCYSTISFFESEVKRMHNKVVKLSEPYIVYWEYVEKAREYVKTRGKSNFSQGSEANAVTRIMKTYGLMPLDVYDGLLHKREYHTHAQMFKEMNSFLKSIKENNSWNEKFVIETIKDIMNKHIGKPPREFKVDGKKYTPISYMKNYVKLNPDDFVDIISLKQEPYYTQIEYPVPDNWWHSDVYYNVPLDVFMEIIENALKNGYTLGIGGDVSESGFSRFTQSAVIPSYDIPQEYINEDARQIRFSNESTTDDHGMHVVGYTKDKGYKWFLIKDSSSGSRNNDPEADEFGYYFFREDYIKLKMMDFIIHKDAVNNILKKFD